MLVLIRNKKEIKLTSLIRYENKLNGIGGSKPKLNNNSQSVANNVNQFENQTVHQIKNNTAECKITDLKIINPKILILKITKPFRTRTS